jgi:hypothetical protein
MTYNSGLTSVTGSVTSVPVTRVVSKVSGTANSGATTLGTVGATKTWYVIGVSLNSAYSATASTSDNNVTANGVAIALTTHNGAVVNTSNASMTIMGTFEAPLAIITATQTLVMNVGNNTRASSIVYYVEV